MRIGCNTGSCRVAQDGPGTIVRDLVRMETPGLEAPCCAHCAGVELDPTMPPASPAELLRQGRGCPISIVAYRAAMEAQKGHQVAVRDRAGMTPVLLVDGNEIDPLKDYKIRACGCGGKA